MKKYVSLSFDDARLDSFRAIKAANNFGLTATLNVTTGYVDGTCPEEFLPCKLPPMSKEQVLELAEVGNEIACHGRFHNNDINNILEGEKIVREWLGVSDGHKLGFASPNSKIVLDDATVTEMKKTFAYLRIGPSDKKFGFFNKAVRKAARIFKSGLCFRAAFSKAINPKDAFILKSVPILNENSVGQILSLIRNIKNDNALIILMFHSILKKGETGYDDTFTWSMGKYEKLCSALAKDKEIEVLNTIDFVNRCNLK